MLKKYLAGFVFVALFLVVSITAFAAGNTPPTSTVPDFWNPLSWALDSVFSGAKFIASSIFTGAMYLIGQLLYGLLYAIDGFAAFLAYWAGIFMDKVLYYTVVNFTPTFIEMATTVNSASGEGLIYYAWSMVRDLLNAGVFFVVVYHAIRAMFNGFDDIKQKFVALLVFVVLVNFSLLFVKVVADISNVAILQMYNVAAKPKGSSPELFFKQIDDRETGLSSYVLNAVNPLSFFASAKVDSAVKAQLEQDSSTALYQLGLILVHGYLVFLFLYISAILLTRAVTFIVLMIASPILVAGWFYSGLEEESKKIKKELIEEALQGPGIVFFLLLSSMIVSGLLLGESFTAASQKIQASSPLVANFVTFFKFAFFAVFNYHAFKFVREITTSGSNRSEKLLGWGLALGLGATGWGLRKTAGAGANLLYENSKFSEKMKDWKKSDSFAKRLVSRNLMKTLDTTRNSSLDIRSGIGALGKTYIGGKILQGTGAFIPMKVDFGKGSSSSAKKTKNAATERANKRRESELEMYQKSGQDDWSVGTEQIARSGVKVKIGNEEKDVSGAFAKRDESLNTIKGIENAIREAAKKPNFNLDSDTIDYNGQTLDKKDVDRKLEEAKNSLREQNGIIKSALDVINEEKDKYISKFRENSEKKFEKDFWKMAAGEGRVGPDGYVREAPARAAAKLASIISGQTVSNATSRAVLAAKKKVEKMEKVADKERMLAAELFNNVKSIVEQADDLGIDMSMAPELAAFTIPKKEGEAAEGRKYGESGTKVELPEGIRKSMFEGSTAVLDNAEKGLKSKKSGLKKSMEGLDPSGLDFKTRESLLGQMRDVEAGLEKIRGMREKMTSTENKFVDYADNKSQASNKKKKEAEKASGGDKKTEGDGGDKGH
jgi:hypothetical protein